MGLKSLQLGYPLTIPSVAQMALREPYTYRPQEPTTRLPATHSQGTRPQHLYPPPLHLLNSPAACHI